MEVDAGRHFEETLAMNRPDWMDRAVQAARRVRRGSSGSRRAPRFVYVILLHDPRRNGRWGLYVGQTARDPDWRFDQHKAGYKSSSAVRRFGVQLLPQLVDHLNPVAGGESLEIEAALAEAFRKAGIPWVEGGH